MRRSIGPIVVVETVANFISAITIVMPNVSTLTILSSYDFWPIECTCKYIEITCILHGILHANLPSKIPQKHKPFVGEEMGKITRRMILQWPNIFNGDNWCWAVVHHLDLMIIVHFSANHHGLQGGRYHGCLREDDESMVSAKGNSK